MPSPYAVFGNPINQSKSPLIHAEFAAELGLDAPYGAILAPKDGFASALKDFIAKGGRGCNVTAPFKIDAFNCATHIMARAQSAGAANVLTLMNGEIIADNVDGVGLVTDISYNLGQKLSGARILIFGAGGATRGALLPLIEADPAQITIANRTLARAVELAELMAPYGILRASALAEVSDRYDIIINATSGALHGDGLAVSPHIFEQAVLAYDMTYGKGLTSFLQLAQQGGAGKLADGVGMLVEQAAESCLIWHGRRPATRDLIAKLRLPLT
ncbi:MAG: shikimate dehydrogenase [Paracoccaceae bacterium]|jgi:shikimate dehydrogenase